MDDNKFYDTYWSGKEEVFENYPRNLALAPFFHENDKILDVGCGDGTVAAFLQKKLHIKVCGVDISQKAVDLAKKRGVEAKVFDVEKKLPFEDQTFDAVFWGDNAEHLFNPSKTLQEIRRVLKPNGRIIMSCPNMGYWRYRLNYLIKGQLSDTEWTGLLPWEWSHIRFFNSFLLHQFLLSQGFKKINKVVGVSARRLDKPFLKVLPSLFGMILIVEAS